jgi:hypothetical protein
MSFIASFVYITNRIPCLISKFITHCSSFYELSLILILVYINNF